MKTGKPFPHSWNIRPAFRADGGHISAHPFDPDMIGGFSAKRGLRKNPEIIREIF